MARHSYAHAHPVHPELHEHLPAGWSFAVMVMGLTALMAAIVTGFCVGFIT